MSIDYLPIDILRHIRSYLNLFDTLNFYEVYKYSARIIEDKKSLIQKANQYGIALSMDFYNVLPEKFVYYVLYEMIFSLKHESNIFHKFKLHEFLLDFDYEGSSKYTLSGKRHESNSHIFFIIYKGGDFCLEYFYGNLCMYSLTKCIDCFYIENRKDKNYRKIKYCIEFSQFLDEKIFPTFKDLNRFLWKKIQHSGHEKEFRSLFEKLL